MSKQRAIRSEEFTLKTIVGLYLNFTENPGSLGLGFEPSCAVCHQPPPAVDGATRYGVAVAQQDQPAKWVCPSCASQALVGMGE